MKQNRTRPKLRTIIRWVGWVLLAQFVLLNISAAFYAYKFTHLYSATEYPNRSNSENIFSKTWRIFSGARVFKTPETNTPSFPYTTVTLAAKKNLLLEAWYSPVDSAIGTVILFHGFSGNKGLLVDIANEFRNRNYNILLVDARAHGNSTGSVTTIGYFEAEDVRLAYDYIRQQGEKNIYLWGASMGAVEIIKAVADYELKPKGIIAEMPFRSLYMHVKARMRSVGLPKQPFAFFITFWMGAEQGFNAFGFNSMKYAKKITCPVLLQCGDNDHLVSTDEIKDIYNSLAADNKKLVWYEGLGHQSFLQSDPAQWRNEIGEFLLRTR